MDKIDYKKQSKELYAPKTEPSLITVPSMNFIMVNGCGNPNDPDGEYSKAVELLYALSFTIKMGRKFATSAKSEENFIDYVVPPLEGLWWLKDIQDSDFTQKDKYQWISMIRQPDFITEDNFKHALEEVRRKKPELEVSKARFETFEEGLCVQCMHIGPYDTEPATIEKIDHFIQNNGLTYDIGNSLQGDQIRRHHEIYLSDPRKANPTTMKTILRHPVKH